MQLTKGNEFLLFLWYLSSGVLPLAMREEPTGVSGAVVSPRVAGLNPTDI